MTSPLWTPDAERVAASRLAQFVMHLNTEHGQALPVDYFALQAWALDHPGRFWGSVRTFCGVIDHLERPGRSDESDESDDVLIPGAGVSDATWFPSARLNFAENLLQRRDRHPALIALLENGERKVLAYDELYEQVAALAASLRAQGIGPGDRVAGFLPNLPQTVIAMLAAASIGALWSSCSPDFGVNGVLDRFGQIGPRVLFVADGYYYNGRTCDSLERVRGISAAIDSIERIVVVPVLNPTPSLQGLPGAVLFDDYLDTSATRIDFERLPFDHPLYIMYSSGTTGAPKCIVHGAGGSLLQHLKEHQLMVGLTPDDVLFYYTTCGWMMWNWLVSGLATGATLVLYDGSPFADEGRVLLDAIEREGITVFGTSATFIAALEKAGQRPRESHDLGSLKTILSTGSPLSHESFDYVYRDVKADVCLSSISGGTDILSCFVGGSETLPVYAGEIQAPGLGMAVAIWDDNGQEAVQGEKGELVCTAPFPSCPLGFWNDPGDLRFHEAYFARFPGVWAHGDYGEITGHGGVVIHGRSDAVLNPGGVRIGTAEIYRQVQRVEDVLASIVIGQQWRGDVRVVLFVVLRAGVQLDDALCDRIRTLVRHNTTPRHVPAKIIQVADIPRTISGKIVEVAVREVVHGRPVKNRDALANPEALELYRDLSQLAQ